MTWLLVNVGEGLIESDCRKIEVMVSSAVPKISNEGKVDRAYL